MSIKDFFTSDSFEAEPSLAQKLPYEMPEIIETSIGRLEEVSMIMTTMNSLVDYALPPQEGIDALKSSVPLTDVRLDLSTETTPGQEPQLLPMEEANIQVSNAQQAVDDVFRIAAEKSAN